MKVEKKEKHKTYVGNSIYKKIRLQSLLKKTLLVLFLILVGNFFVAKIFNYNLLEDIGKRVLKLAGIYTEAVPSITLESADWEEQEEGSYQIIKSAKWTGRNEAKITLNVKSIASVNLAKDVIFVLDKSYSMQGEKLQKLKDDALELTDMMLKDEKLHKIALVTFSTDSEIVTTFTRDKTTIDNAINGMEAEGTTNYNAALKNVMKILQESNYKQQDGRELVILFLTDGLPTEDTPNEVVTYSILKEQYPYSIVNGVEYEMGSSISYQLTRVSDNQFKAKMSNLGNVLLEAAIGPDKYEEFTITDTINNEYFEVKDKSDIKVSVNDVKVESKFDLVNESDNQKIVWDLTENYVSGAEITMEIKIYLKDKYEHEDEFYPTNSKLDVVSKIPTKNSKTRSTTDSPVLQLVYDVIYDTNPPLSCNNIKEYNKERHYVFENVEKNTEKLTCDGYIFKGWEVVEEDVEKVNDDVFVMPDHDVQVRATWSKPMITKNMEGTVNEKITLYRTVEKEYTSGSEFVAKYEGEVEDSLSNPSANENVYYYQGMATTNNVIFGGFCWQMVRTTKTGGIKMLYNGILSSTGVCDERKLSENEPFIPKIEEDGTEKSWNYIYFNNSDGLPPYVGYMYNKTEDESGFRSLSTEVTITREMSGMNNEYSYYFSKNIKYDESTRMYELIEPELHIWGDLNKRDYEGWYFCKDRETTSCSTVYYFSVNYYSDVYSGSLTRGATESEKYLFGKSYTKDESGVYTLQEIVEVDKKDWVNNYNYKGYYTCKDLMSTSCSTMYYIDKSDHSYDRNYHDEYYFVSLVEISELFGNSCTYENGVYTLTDAKTYDELKGDLSSHHYTCFNSSGKCQKVNYYYYGSYDIELNSGQLIENILKEMLWADDVNKVDSNIKKYIDRWYEKYINGKLFENDLEEFMFCNDRSIYDLGGWNPNGGKIDSYLYYGGKNRMSKEKAILTCPNKTDKFSISNPLAQLKYPIGLLSLDEAYLTINNQKSYLSSELSSGFYFGTPHTNKLMFGAGYRSVRFDTNYEIGSAPGEYVRPVISLRPNIEYSEGDGTPENPYIISVGE